MNIRISIPKEFRKMKIIHAVFTLVFCLVAHYTSAQQNHQKLEASIEQAMAGSLQEITYTYTVGDEKITQGGGIRFEYPVAYAETEFLFWSRPQTEEPELLGYVSARSLYWSRISSSNLWYCWWHFSVYFEGWRIK